MDLFRYRGDEFQATGEYLGIAPKDWWGGWIRKDKGVCRHCLVNGPSEFNEFRDGVLYNFAFIYKLDPMAA